MNLSLLGSVELQPTTPVVAGSTGSWTIRYTVGETGIDEGGTIKLAKRFASDWEKPQFDQPSESGYTTVITDGPAQLGVRFAKKAHDRPWMNWCIVIDVYDGSLSPGDCVTIVLGDRSEGSTGIRAQTFIESRHDFRIFADPTNAAVSRPVPSSPTIPIIAGEPVELVCVLPTDVLVGDCKKIRLKGQDRWMNPTPAPANSTFSWEGDATAEIENGTIRFSTPGTGRLRIDAGDLSTRSNPVSVTVEPPAFNKYWGDLHAQSDATVGTGTEEEYFTFCRDQAFADIASHQGNDFQMTDEDWSRLNDTVRMFNEPGRFVVLPGYEWSANTPAGGDRNVFYSEEDQPIYRSSHWQVPEVDADAETPAHPASELFERIRANGKGILAAHVGGRYADIKKYFDQETCPLVEVLSCWGIFEWMLWDAFDMGYVVGVMANSDGHKGRPGAEGPGAGDFGIAGGLTCVLSPELTREAIFDALKNRRCYGTSGPRIDLDFTIDGQPMGSILTGNDESRKLHARVRSVAPLDSLILYRGREILETIRPAGFDNLADSNRVRVTWEGARMRGRGRRIDWSGTIKVEGAKILKTATLAFDSPADGITSENESEVAFRSRTTGDLDGIDLFLDNAADATICLCTPEGEFSAFALEESWQLDGIDQRVVIRRYPETLACLELSLEKSINAPTGVRTPYFIKATQSDGHLAWSSPIYVEKF